MKIHKIILLLGLATTLYLSSCNDSYLDRFPEALNDETFWKTTEDLKTYVNRFYDVVIPTGLESRGDGYSDNQVPNSRQTSLWNEGTVPVSGGGWAAGDWQYIRYANYFMGHYEKASGLVDDINMYVAEVRFFRAMLYHTKIRTFGDVPWIDKALTTSDTDLLYGSKMKREDVMANIIKDIDFAIRWLPEEPASGRLSKYVALQLKARMCLHEATYYRYHNMASATLITDLLTKAANAADSVITSGKFEVYNTGNPDSDYYDMFLIDDKSSLKEAVMRVEYKKDVRMHNTSRTLSEANTGFSKDFVKSYLCLDGDPISVSPQYVDDLSITNESTDRDPRFKQTIMTLGFPTRIEEDGTTTYPTEENLISQYCYTGYRIIKYFSPHIRDWAAGTNTYDGIAFRYAEVLLIYAEAKAELGTITQADLDISINELRDRAGMPHMVMSPTTDPDWPAWGYTLSPLLQEIRRERRVELAGEGFRWDDLRRWKAGVLLNNNETYLGKWVAADNNYAVPYPGYENTRVWNDRLYLSPIPSGEILLNPNLLPQNPGWE